MAPVLLGAPSLVELDRLGKQLLAEPDLHLWRQITSLHRLPGHVHGIARNADCRQWGDTYRSMA